LADCAKVQHYHVKILKRISDFHPTHRFAGRRKGGSGDITHIFFQLFWNNKKQIKKKK